jgi:methylated-DNA-[protein]-cysteine S-methyltransferase
MQDDAGIYARESEFLDRYVQIGVAGDRVLSVSFPTTPDEEAGEDHPLLDRIDAYLQGEEDDFADVTVAMTMPTDRRKVLEALREVPYGERASVEQIAMMTPGLTNTDDDDLRSVREALDDNPVPLFLPDHRVVDGPSGAPPVVVQRLQSLEGI